MQSIRCEMALQPQAPSLCPRYPLRFLAGRHTRRQNQALSVLPLSLDFLSVSVVLLTTGAPFCVVLFCVICVFCLLVVLVRLSVPVQVIDWKDSSPKWPTLQCVDGDVKPYSLFPFRWREIINFQIACRLYTYAYRRPYTYSRD